MAKPARSRTPPSPAVLSLLAAILASSPLAAANPTPPAFLCPSVDTHPSPTVRHRRSVSPPPPAVHRPKSRRFAPDRALPFKFEPGQDGVWRRVETYTLYGSTVCSVLSCQQPTNAISADEVSTNPDPSSNTTQSIKLHDTLPAGWFPVPGHDESRTTLILALSLVLALFICFFIIGCLFWRRTVRRRHKDGDLEMKTRRACRLSAAIPPNAQSQADTRKEAKGKQKIWARATARWKQNALYTARKRRGRRFTTTRSQALDSSSTTLHPSVPTETPDDGDASTVMSRAHSVSRSVSHRSSIESSFDTSSSSSNQPQENSDNAQTPPSVTLSSSPGTSSSPPAYRQGTLVNPIIIPSGGLSVPDEHADSGSLVPPSPRPSHLSFNTSPIEGKSSISVQGSDTPQISVHGAHVATDDKALLARLADLAERPPWEIPDNAGSSHQVSVPLWEDEQLEDFIRASESSEADTSGSTQQPLFPPPPTKGKMAEPSFYAYRCSFEEFSESIDPEMGPSAPPFEAPGAPVHGDMVMLPSAPPLTEDFLESYPNAPQFEPAAEDDTSPDPLEVNSERNAEHPSTAISRPLSEGTLPGYQP